MRIAILGTGQVGRLLGGAFIERGHEVIMGTRDVEATLRSNQAVQVFLGRHRGTELSTFAASLMDADLVVNAIAGQKCVEALAQIRQSLSGLIVMDVSSPFSFVRTDDPLDPANDDSLGEQIQRALPASRVVKTLNTVAADVMVRRAGVDLEDQSIFVSGDDVAAKALVSALLGELGWGDIIDLGGIRTSRATEMMLRMWLDVSVALNTHMFGFRVVRKV